jgi:hypothetical protein
MRFGENVVLAFASGAAFWYALRRKQAAAQTSDPSGAGEISEAQAYAESGQYGILR